MARRDLLKNRVPSVPGGGTVAYVNAHEHRYLTDAEHREEGGTPNIVGAIRAGRPLGSVVTLTAAHREREGAHYKDRPGPSQEFVELVHIGTPLVDLRIARPRPQRIRKRSSGARQRY